MKAYEGDGGPLERSKTTPRGPKIGKTKFWMQRAKSYTPKTINIAGKMFQKRNKFRIDKNKFSIINNCVPNKKLINFKIDQKKIFVTMAINNI